jgi:hypothetical protein
MLTTDHLGRGLQAVYDRLVRKIAVLEKAACNAGRRSRHNSLILPLSSCNPRLVFDLVS